MSLTNSCGGGKKGGTNPVSRGRETIPPCQTTRGGSLRRHASLVRKLEKNESIDDYNAVIQEQLAEGIVERAPNSVEGREFYIPHKRAQRETAKSTKLRIVYDASARAWDGAPSLNECLNTGPSLQNQLWSVLIRGRVKPIAITGDIKPESVLASQIPTRRKRRSQVPLVKEHRDQGS